ncbi:hypothetical protein [Paenibacillus sp. Soil766]|nr:hypothetical protein [Paenibacillus sp. Soil766]
MTASFQSPIHGFCPTAHTDEEIDATLLAANGWVSEDNVSAFLCG